jgi:hypothetical protein
MENVTGMLEIIAHVVNGSCMGLTQIYHTQL